MIGAVLFDVDGTLLDTNDYIYGAFEHTFKRHGHTVLSRDEMHHLAGRPLEECYRVFTNRTEVTELMGTHHQFQLDNPALAKAYPHTLETLSALKKKDIKLGAITTRAANTVHDTLASSGIDAYIDYVVTIDDVHISKPDPEGIFLTLNAFGLGSDDAIMVGDTPADIHAGKNAGVRTVGAAYGLYGEHIVEEEPDFVIDDIKEIVEIVHSIMTP